MANYVVTSNRLSGFERGQTVTDQDLQGVDVKALLDAGHISTQSTKKPAKTKDTETDKD